MQGRLENELKLQQATEKIIEDCPEFVHEWYLNMKALRKTASSCRDFATKIHRFLEYINPDTKEIQPSDITAQACESFMISCQTKRDKNGMMIRTTDTYQRNVWYAINSLLDFMVKSDYDVSNYMNDIKKPKHENNKIPNKKERHLTQRDFNKILAAAKERDNFMNGILGNRDVLIILLFLTTGMKKSAIVSINIEDIDFKNNLLTVVNNVRKTDVYVLNEQVMLCLNRWLKDRESLAGEESGNALFLSKDGKRLGDDTIYNIVNDCCYKAINMKLSPQKLRAGFCSVLYKKTGDLEFVKNVVGHYDIHTTQKYVKPKGNERQKTAKIMAKILDV